jgi:hypothetical protein
MPKWSKMILALLLLPICMGGTSALGRVLRSSGGADTVWVPLVAGAACWVVIYLLLPKPMWLYVVGHELTHVVWTWLFWGRVKRFRATARGGHVVVTRGNFLVTLAPYFFPFYAVVVVALFGLGHLLWGWTQHLAWFHLFLGAAYAFHVTLTLQILQTRQTDVTDQGYFFSGVILWLGNVSVLLLGVAVLTHLGVRTALEWWLQATIELLRRATFW